VLPAKVTGPKSVDPTLRNNLACVTKTDELMVQETRMFVMD